MTSKVWLLLLGCLLVLLVAAPRLAAFSGDDPLRTGDDESQAAVDAYHHQKLTHDAAIDAVGFDPKAARRLAWHADYIDSYLYSPLWWLKPLDPTFERFRRSLTIAPALEKLHFDDLTSTPAVIRAWDRYTTGTLAGLLFAAQRGDVEAARNTLGISAHALQDFYSHSNWIDDPDRRTKTWFDLTPQQRASLKLYTGQYESRTASIKPHGKINLGCVVMCQPAVRRSVGAICDLGLLPMGDSKLCKLYRECKNARSVPSGVKVRAGGIPIPPSLIYFGPPGIAVDNRWMSPIGARVRGVDFGARPEAAFDIAFRLAQESTRQWFMRVQAEMREAGYGAFWERVKIDRPGPFSARHAQYEDLGQVPYQFMSAGPYPSNTPTQTEEWYLRLKLKTSRGLGGGTDADIFAIVDGRRYLLDYRGKARKQTSDGEIVSATTTDLGKSPFLTYNDFEAGDDTTYTIGPLPAPPRTLRLENEAGGVGSVSLAVSRSIRRSIERVGEHLKKLFRSLTGGAPDYIAQWNLLFEYGGRDGSLDLAKAARNSAGSNFSIDLNGGGEGHHRLSGNVRKVGQGTNDALGDFDEFEVFVKDGKVLRESKNDRGSSSDEPFFVFVYSPLTPGTKATLGPVSLFKNRDTGSNLPFGNSQRFRFKVTRDIGMFDLAVAAWESDDETHKERMGIARDFAGDLRNAIKDEEDDVLQALGKLVGAAWGLERVQAYAFNRAGGLTPVKAGAVLDVRVNKRVPANSTLPPFSLNRSAIRTFPTSAQELQQKVPGPVPTPTPTPLPTTTPTTTPAPAPDLKITRLVITGDQGFRIVADVSNVGSAAAAASQTRIAQEGETPAMVNTPALAPGATTTVTVDCVYGGLDRATATADATGLVAESREDNNGASVSGGGMSGRCRYN